MADFCEVLREARAKEKISYAKLSKLCGVPVSTIINYEVNGIKPTLGKADAILKALGISLTIGEKQEDNK